MYELNSFNSLVNRFIMKSNQDKTYSSYNLVNKNDFFKYIDKTQNSTYSYPNVDRIAYQMRWLKVSLAKGFETVVSAYKTLNINY